MLPYTLMGSLGAFTKSGQDGAENGKKASPVKLTRAEKKAVYEALRWLWEYHAEMCSILDPDKRDPYPAGGYHIQSAIEKFRADVEGE